MKLPAWIYESPYKALLYWVLIIQTMPETEEQIIFKLMLDKKYAEAYRIYNQLKSTQLCKKYVNYENFIFYYKRWKDVVYLLHHHKLVQKK